MNIPTTHQVVMPYLIMHGASRFADFIRHVFVSNANFFIYVENADASFEKALSQKCTVVMPLANQDYGRSGGVKDPFGNTWWITSLIEK